MALGFSPSAEMDSSSARSFASCMIASTIPCTPHSRVSMARLQGYLTYKKTHPPRTLP